MQSCQLTVAVHGISLTIGEIKESFERFWMQKFLTSNLCFRLFDKKM